MQTRFPRTLLAMSAALALTAAALTPAAAFAKGPGPGAGDCDGDCTNEQPQAQQQAREGSGGQVQTRAGDGSAQQTATQANVGGGGQVRARAGDGDGNGFATQAGGRYQGSTSGAGRGWDEDQPRGPEACADCDVEMGVLDDAQTAELLYMANEEKLAHDVYAALADQFGARIFERIAMSEARHQLAVDTVLDRYGIENPTDGLPAGVFFPEDGEIAALWDELMELGPQTYEEALAVGVLIEETDIADLEVAMAALEGDTPDTYDAPDVQMMYSHLLAASKNHLAAFESQLQ